MNMIASHNAHDHHEVFHRPQINLNEVEFNEAVRISVETIFALSRDRRLSPQELRTVTQYSADIARFKQARAQG